jgi:hypothetical protein
LTAVEQMDELSQLIETLQQEVGALEQTLQQREVDEGARLQQAEAKLEAWTARVTQAQAALQRDGAALSVVEAQRAQLLERIDSWQGQLWRIGYGSLVATMATLAMTSAALGGTWLPGPWGGVWIAGQAALFGVLYFVIPEKR